MKNNIALLFLLMLSVLAEAQSGQYAGTMKKLIGTSYEDSRNIPGLERWEYLGGSLLSGIDDPETITVDIFKKGTTRIVFISIQGDSSSQHVISDVVEIKNVQKGQEIKTSVCRNNKKEDMWIIALIKPAAVDYSRAIKAWHFNRDKRRFRVISAKTVDCMNEGYEQF